MRIDEPVPMRAAVHSARHDADHLVGDEPAAQAWLLEIERAQRDAWHCEATVPQSLDPAVAGAHSAAVAPATGPTAEVLAVRRTGAGERPVRPYGLHELEPVAGSTTSTVAPPRNVATVTRMSMPSASLASCIGTDVATTTTVDALPAVEVDAALPARAALRGIGPTGRPDDAGKGSGDGDAPAPGAARGRDGAEAAPAANGRGPLSGAGRGEFVPVRLHVERGADGLLNAWLGVDRGASVQAAAIVAHWREDARRRGDVIGTVHVNGQAIAGDGGDPRGMPSKTVSSLAKGDRTNPPVITPALIESNTGKH